MIQIKLNLSNGFKGYRKRNGDFFFEFQEKLGICNEDFLHAFARNFISDEEFYKCIGHHEPQNSVSELDMYKIDEFEKRVKEENLSVKKSLMNIWL